MSYHPNPPPNGQAVNEILNWAYNELRRIAYEVQERPLHLVTPVTGTATARDPGLYLCDATSGAFTVTLVENASSEIRLVKTDASANAITVQGAGTISGSANKSLSSQWESLTVVCDGTNWFEMCCTQTSAPQGPDPPS
jgi:hypothetical protein